MSGHNQPKTLETLTRKAFSAFERLHREKQAVRYNQSCILNGVTPRFVREKITKNIRNHRAFSNRKINKREMDILTSELDTK